MFENKSSIFSYLTNEMWRLVSRNNSEVHTIIFVFSDLFCML